MSTALSTTRSKEKIMAETKTTTQPKTTRAKTPPTKVEVIEHVGSAAVDKLETVVRSGLLQRALHNRLINDKTRLPIGFGVVAAAGGAIGYIVGRRRIQFSSYEVPAQLSFDFEKGEKGVDDFVATARTMTGIPQPVVIDAGDYEIIVDKGAEFVEEILDISAPVEGTIEIIEPEVEAVPVRRSVFAQTGDDWNYEAEKSRRTMLEPYVIHRDEYYEDGQGFTQTTLTYYAGDDIMVDEEDKPMYNVSSIVGPLRFGHGSNDPKVFYVRNEKRRAEYEIVHHEGTYTEEVLGEIIEDSERNKDLRHSATPRFRQTD
jgi:hypothetical protein